MDIAAANLESERWNSLVGPAASRRPGDLNVEVLTADFIRQTDRKSAIRFSAGTATIVLGFRDYGRGWYSAYFARLVATRLGIPLHRLRVYYSATLPDVLQTPREFGILSEGRGLGPFATAVEKLIDEMCGRVVENGKAIFAELIGAAPATIEFDQTARRFFALDGGRSASILHVAQGGCRQPGELQT